MTNDYSETKFVIKFKEIWGFIKKRFWLRIPATILIFASIPIFAILTPIIFVIMKIHDIYCEIWDL
jgi:hypothetical protein